MLRLNNFATATVFMAAALRLSISAPVCPLALGAPPLMSCWWWPGFFIERAAYKPLRTAPRMSVMISAIGVSYLLQNFATYITGGLPQMYPSIPGLSSQVTIAGVSTKWVTVVTPILVVVLVIALTQLINHTKIGMAMRAASRDFETAQLMGIKINSVISFTFVSGPPGGGGLFAVLTNYQSIGPCPAPCGAAGLRRRCSAGIVSIPRRRGGRLPDRHLRERHQVLRLVRVLRRCTPSPC
jgi:branched-chain amino acid transport system permease protein